MPKAAKASQEASEKSKQPKLADYHLRVEEQKANANANPSPCSNASSVLMAASDGEDKQKTQNSKLDEILSTVNSMKMDFSSRFNKVVDSIDGLRKEINDCIRRVSQTETRISDAEDVTEILRAKVNTLESNEKVLEDKVMDLEARSRRNNLRLVNLPEGAEGQDPCVFLERWLPEMLGTGAVVIERAHRIGPKRDSNTPPRTLIMRFLNYKDKQVIFAAARAKNDIRFQNQQVRMYPDTAAGLHQLRKQFDSVRVELRKLGLWHGVAHPAKLLVTYKGQTHSFTTAVTAREFVKKVQKAAEEDESLPALD